MLSNYFNSQRIIPFNIDNRMTMYEKKSLYLGLSPELQAIFTGCVGFIGNKILFFQNYTWKYYLSSICKLRASNIRIFEPSLYEYNRIRMPLLILQNYLLVFILNLKCEKDLGTDVNSLMILYFAPYYAVSALYSHFCYSSNNKIKIFILILDLNLFGFIFYGDYIMTSAAITALNMAKYAIYRPNKTISISIFMKSYMSVMPCLIYDFYCIGYEKDIHSLL